jgi:hypothetical protein
MPSAETPLRALAAWRLASIAEAMEREAARRKKDQNIRRWRWARMVESQRRNGSR